MTSRKHNRFWLALTLLLAMVAFAVAPARVPACAALDSSTMGVLTAAQQVCRATGRVGHCCCGVKAPQAGPAKSGCTIASWLHCGCSLQAPATPPAALQTSAMSLALVAGALPQHPVSLALPVNDLWGLTLCSTGPPRTPFGPSAPSRAPPVC